MYTKAQVLLRYLRYYANAANGRGHGVHSPFVYDFIRRVLMDHTRYDDYEKVEALRTSLLQDKTILQVKDMGAGSVTGAHTDRAVAGIARYAAKPRKYAQLLYRIVRHYQPQRIVELGTSLGLTTAYFSLAQPSATVVTLEGAEEIANVAGKNFRELGLSNVRMITGNFDDTLKPLLDSVPAVDFVFIDGNHRFEPTVRYFGMLLKKCTNDTIVILDDIHWSREMEQAWELCRGNNAVTLSIDLFFIGILVFRKEILEKQAFRVRF